MCRWGDWRSAQDARGDPYDNDEMEVDRETIHDKRKRGDKREASCRQQRGSRGEREEEVRERKKGGDEEES
jgi:hypothetical protein